MLISSKSNSPTTSNKYVEIAAIETLRVAFGLHGTAFFDQAQQRVGRGRFLPVISIILLGDNDFYRQPKGKVGLILVSHSYCMTRMMSVN